MGFGGPMIYIDNNNGVEYLVLVLRQTEQGGRCHGVKLRGPGDKVGTQVLRLTRATVDALLQPVTTPSLRLGRR